MATGEEIVRRTTTKRYQLGVICGPYLDIALKKIRKKLDWIKFSEKFLTGAHDIRYYHFDHYLEDFRGSSYIGKLESLNFKII
ncbi:MAG: hypothetical protein NZO16_06405, partial [Deltaproteobacteria bacterium]|nr:hypothetical protein [Deltaproteobacteria bacterium]